MDKFLELLQKAAETVGLQAVRLWPEVVAVHWIVNLSELIMTPLAIGGLSLLAYKLLSASFVEGYADGYIKEGKVAALAAFGVLAALAAAIFIVVYFALFSTMVAAVLYPEASLVLSKITK